MNFAETEGTDIKSMAESEGTDINNMAETEGTDSCMKFHGKKIKNIMFVLTVLFFSQSALATDLKLFTTDNQNFKGVIQHNGQISFVEGYFEANKGYFMLNNTLEINKASDEGTGGDKASDEGTGGDYASDEGTGGDYASDEGTGGDYASDEGTGGDYASDEGTGGDYASDEGTGGDYASDEGTGGDYASDEGTGGDYASDEGTGGDYASDEGTGGDYASDEGTGGDYASDEGTGNTNNSALITVNFGCNNQKSMAVLESNNYFKKMQINSVQINGQLKKCS